MHIEDVTIIFPKISPFFSPVIAAPAGREQGAMALKPEAKDTEVVLNLFQKHFSQCEDFKRVDHNNLTWMYLKLMCQHERRSLVIHPILAVITINQPKQGFWSLKNFLEDPERGFPLVQINVLFKDNKEDA